MAGGPAGRSADYLHCVDTVLFHCSGLTQHSVVLSDGRCADSGRNDVFYAGGGDLHDSHGRTRGFQSHPKPEPVSDRDPFFLLGLIITISEPDLQVLAGQVPAIPSIILILSVACGVGVFLVIALLRMLFSVPLPPLLIAFYVLIFALSAFVPKDFLNIAFDSGGVTTGPMTVPFIMALGAGVSAIRSDRHAADDSFGLEAAQKVVIFAFVTDSEWKRIKTGLQRQMKIDVPGSGIAFIIPVSSVGGKKQLQFLTEGRDFNVLSESLCA